MNSTLNSDIIRHLKSWKMLENTWDMPGLKVETRLSQILLSNLPGAISRVFLNIFWHFLCLNLSTFHGDAASWLSYPSACHWMAPMMQKGRQVKKYENFKNFQILPPKWAKKSNRSKKKLYKIFLYILCHYVLILAFKFFETREKMPADHDLVVFGQSACRAQFETLKAKLGPWKPNNWKEQVSTIPNWCEPFF